MKPELRIDFQIAACTAQQIAIGPNSTDACDESARQRNCHAHRITVIDCRWPALATTDLVPPCDQVGGPYDRTCHPHFTENCGDFCAVARCLDIQLGQPRAFTPFAAEYRLVDVLSDQQTNRTANRAADFLPDRV